MQRAATAAAAISLAAPALASAAPSGLDPRFGAGGITVTNVLAEDVASAVVVQPNGKLVVVGTNVEEPDFLLARFNSNGKLDPTFAPGGLAGDGKQVTDFGGFDRALDVALQPDGKIVVAGVTEPAVGSANFALARYTPDGALDPTFSGDGRLTTDIGPMDEARAVALQPDGKIVAAGVTGEALTNGSCCHSGDFAVARYLPGGGLDTKFGKVVLGEGSGVQTTEFDGNDEAADLTLQPDGKIVAAGSTHEDGPILGQRDFALARYEADGELDPTFSGGGPFPTGGGRRVTDVSGSDDWVVGVSVTPSGEIVAAGNYSGLTTPGGIALARYQANGALDPAFGGGGKQIAARSHFVTGFALQPDGKIVVGGVRFVPEGTDFGIARFGATGFPDPAFAGGGSHPTDLGGDDEAHGLALQADGKIVAVGGTDRDAMSFDFALVRYLGDADTVVDLKILGRRLRLNRKGRVRARLRCPAKEASGPCRGRLQLKTRRKVGFEGRRRKVMLAAARYRVGAGATKRVGLQLPLRKARLLRASTRAREVKALTRVRDGAGNKALVTKAIRVVAE